MNYYIQGDAAKADQINAAFKKLGYDTSTSICLELPNRVMNNTLTGKRERYDTRRENTIFKS